MHFKEEDFPCFVNHPIRPGFFCESLAFLETLEDCDEYEALPFTGPRKYIPKKTCANCRSLQTKIHELKAELAELKLEKLNLEDDQPLKKLTKKKP